MTTWFRYVRSDDIARYRANGWRVVSDLSDCHHGAHAVLMQWEGAGEPSN